MALYVARMGSRRISAVGIINLIDMKSWFNFYGDEGFIGKVQLSFCPRLGEYVKYFNDDYVVKKVVHTEDIVNLFVRKD